MKIEYIGAIDNSSRDAILATEKYVENAIEALLDVRTLKNKD